jgi:hypothetical protein
MKWVKQKKIESDGFGEWWRGSGVGLEMWGIVFGRWRLIRVKCFCSDEIAIMAITKEILHQLLYIIKLFH